MKALEKPLAVRCFCLLASGVEVDEPFLRRVHDLNLRLTLARLVLVKGSVFAAIDIPADPFHAAHLAVARAVLEAVANDARRALRLAPDADAPAAGHPGSLPN